MSSELKEIVSNLPNQAGVYKFKDSTDRVIYVGKAVNLKSRVGSYFNSSADHSVKVRALVRHIASIEHIVVGDERDALLLENNLIKELQPRYNILLKDSKTYPWIAITNEPFARVISTREKNRTKAEYYGPYPSVGVQRVLLQLIHTLYPIRTCKLVLSQQNIAKGKFSVCLKYHMGHCRGGCVGKESEQKYREYISEVREILKGNLKQAALQLEYEMKEEAMKLNFEGAESLKRKLLALDDYRTRSVVVSNHLGNLDVVGLMSADDGTAHANHLRVVDGAVVGCYTFELKGGTDEKEDELMSFALSQLDLKSREIVVSHYPTLDYIPEEVESRCFVPQRGDKVRLVELSQKNCKFYRLEKLKNIEKKDPEHWISRVMKAMKKELNLREEPRHIECFDNSNLGGEFPVAACVVFKDGKPAKRDYRHFNIKTVVGANDFASMYEVVGRRYSRLLEEEKELPQLVVIDGGKGQLGAAYQAADELGITDRVTFVGLAKRMEELYFVGDATPHYFDKKGETLRIIMYLRDEAHRFGITFHRKQRSKAMKIKVERTRRKTAKEINEKVVENK